MTHCITCLTLYHITRYRGYLFLDSDLMEKAKEGLISRVVEEAAHMQLASSEEIAQDVSDAAPHEDKDDFFSTLKRIKMDKQAKVRLFVKRKSCSCACSP